MKQLVVGPSASTEKGNGVTLITEAILQFSGLYDLQYIDSVKKENNVLGRLLYFLFPCGVVNISLVVKIYRRIKKNKIRKVLFIGPEHGYNSLIISALFNIPVSYALIDNKPLIYKRALLSSLTYGGRLKSFIGYGFATATYTVLGILNKQVNFIFVSDDDAQQAANYFEKVHIIKNGTAIMRGSSKPFSKGGRPKYVFHGDFNYEPNLFARDIFIRFVVNTHNRGVIFGKNNKESSDVNIELMGYVEDMKKYITNRHIYFCPLPYGGGIKNKVLEALAAGMLVVGTQYAFDGIDTSKIECILLDLSEIGDQQSDIEIDRMICKKYIEYNPRVNIDYISKHHNWNDQVRKYLML